MRGMDAESAVRHAKHAKEPLAYVIVRAANSSRHVQTLATGRAVEPLLS